jgi:hypothetical protein
VTAFLVVEHHGPWGDSAPRASRLPEPVKRHLGSHHDIKVLLARRHLRAHRGTAYRVFLCFPGRRLLLGTMIQDHAELAGIDLDAISRGEAPDWERVDGPLLGVCTHGRHDACCAERGRPVAAALSASRPDATWEISHMGGDRFAANMLVLPEGLYYGQMDPGTATQVVELHEQGRVDLTRLRGRASLPMAVQYAEIALRRHLEEDRLYGVRLMRREGPTSVFVRDGAEWAVTVGRTTADASRLTCAVERLSPVPVFEVLGLRQL